MATTAGITIERRYNGMPKTITFDYKRYGDLLRNFFLKEGLTFPYSPYNKQETESLLKTKSAMQLGARKKVDMSDFWD